MTKEQHKRWLMARGLLPGQIQARKTKNTSWKREYVDSLRVDRSDYVSAGFGSGSTARRDIHMKMASEPESVQKEIRSKMSRVAPGWNKGNLIYITDNQDPTDLGRKK